MLRREADQIADGVLRRLRPFLVDFISAAMADPEPPADEDSYIADRAARQLDRYRATGQSPRQAKRCAAAVPRRKPD